MNVSLLIWRTHIDVCNYNISPKMFSCFQLIIHFAGWLFKWKKICARLGNRTLDHPTVQSRTNAFSVMAELEKSSPESMIFLPYICIGAENKNGLSFEIFFNKILHKVRFKFGGEINHHQEKDYPSGKTPQV